jgi:hypothetical protein
LIIIFLPTPFLNFLYIMLTFFSIYTILVLVYQGYECPVICSPEELEEE